MTGIVNSTMKYEEMDCAPQTVMTSSGRHLLYVLVTYSVVITGSFVAIVVIGSERISSLQSRCQNDADYSPVPHDIRVYNADGEQFAIDAKANREVISGSEEGLNASVMVIDYKKSLIGWLIPEAEECYLIGGVDNRMPDSRRLQKQFQEGQIQNTTADVSDQFTYTKKDDRPVTDHNLLPMELRARCRDKDVYWLDRTSDTQGGRQKRGYCVRVCVYRNGIRVCYRRCG